MVDAMQPLAIPTIVLPTVEQVFTWLEDVSDPEIPVVSIIDLGIVREVLWRDDVLVVAITPTYSGCPAMVVIEQEIGKALALRGLYKMRLERRLSPAWTTDWLSAKGRQQLREYGIAPPTEKVIDITGISRARRAEPSVNCPRCGSARTKLTSQFGSTACKALYVCVDCQEPFDYFKPH
jgi:ring-1,2-phenylacetyl-CoA epoxidase subunit PaaD